jgi:hypothetical protein
MLTTCKDGSAKRTLFWTIQFSCRHRKLRFLNRQKSRRSPNTLRGFVCLKSLQVGRLGRDRLQHSRLSHSKTGNNVNNHNNQFCQIRFRSIEGFPVGRPLKIGLALLAAGSHRIHIYYMLLPCCNAIVLIVNLLL